MGLSTESSSDCDGATDARAGDEADDGVVFRGIGGGEVGAFEAEGGAYRNLIPWPVLVFWILGFSC